ncbi:MAG: nitrogenase component 1 [Lachnospiraceae bacterium]|nr:nitrogenase component 1 [Lachnospiraceae bacterium]
MKGLLKYLSPFAPDQSGAVAALYTYGGIIVICDAGGCTGNICGFDEPRWFENKSAVFSAGLRDMDAILGRDDRLVEKLKSAADQLGGSFAAIIGTPVPAVIATDYKALKRMAEKKCGMPVLALECTGTHLYDAGAEKAYLELFKTFAQTPTEASAQNTAGILGLIPLDVNTTEVKEQLTAYYKEKGYSEVFCYGMGDGLDTVQKAGQVSKNIVVSPAALKTAKYLEETFGTPYEVEYPLIDDTLKEQLSALKGKRVLIIHQQVMANEIRKELLAAGASEAVCGTWFMKLPELSEDADMHFETENDFIDHVLNGNYDAVIADHMFHRALKNYGGTFIDCDHFAVSGTLWI